MSQRASEIQTHVLLPPASKLLTARDYDIEIEPLASALTQRKKYITQICVIISMYMYITSMMYIFRLYTCI